MCLDCVVQLHFVFPRLSCAFLHTLGCRFRSGNADCRIMPRWEFWSADLGVMDTC